MQKIIGIFIVTLLIISVLPSISAINRKNIDEFILNDEYDLVIIAPEIFTGELQRLVDHKNNYGMRTMMKTTEDIYTEFFGVDKPEQIKYFIKDSYDNWNIKYVLLVGGLNSLIIADSKDDRNQGSNNWYIPVRYTNLNDGYEPGYISDLYYADLYDSDGNFSSWDADSDGKSDGIFGFWGLGPSIKKDLIDLYPDVYLGRLACRNNYEVKIMVDKIINYESTPAESSWFNKMVVVGGENWDDTQTNYLEGELICEEALSYMGDFDPVRIYASNRDTGELVPMPNDIINTISDGCGFILFSGFGDPSGWATHWPGVFNWDDFPDHLRVYHFLKLSNENKLPVCIIGANKCSQFNVTLKSTLLDEPNMDTHGIPIAECTSWHLTRKANVGSIATIGATAASYGSYGENGDGDNDGINEPDCIEQFSGYLSIQFFKQYNDGKIILGEMFGGALINYINTFDCMSNQIDCKTVQSWTLLGDPSLMIGGYS